MHGNDIDKPEEGVLPSSSLKLSDDFMVVEPCSSRHVQIRECLLTCHGLATMPVCLQFRLGPHFYWL